MVSVLLQSLKADHREALDVLKSVRLLWETLNQPVKLMDTHAALALAWLRADDLSERE